VWGNNGRRRQETVPTSELLRTYGPDYRAIFVGDACMCPYELVPRGRLGGALERRVRRGLAAAR